MISADVAEGFNGKAKLTTRTAHGFRTLSLAGRQTLVKVALIGHRAAARNVQAPRQAGQGTSQHKMRPAASRWRIGMLPVSEVAGPCGTPPFHVIYTQVPCEGRTGTALTIGNSGRAGGRLARRPFLRIGAAELAG